MQARAASAARHAIAGLSGSDEVDHLPGLRPVEAAEQARAFVLGRCRNRVWRWAHGAVPKRLESCAWCGAPLLYMPQDRLPGCRLYCDTRCARQAWLLRRAARSMSSLRAVEIAIRKLRKSRYPRHLAAASALVELQRQLLGGEPKIAGFLIDPPRQRQARRPRDTAEGRP